MKCTHCGSDKSFRKQSRDHQSYGVFCDRCGRMIKIEKKEEQEKAAAGTDGLKGN